MQSEFSLLYREEATETREAIKDLGISFVAYAPLGRSLLAGVIPDFANLAAGDTRARHPRFEGENFEKNRALVERVEAMAADKECTVAQLVAILELVRSEGLSVLERILEQVLDDPFRRLQGDNSSGVPVAGVDFWKVAPRGAAGSSPAARAAVS